MSILKNGDENQWPVWSSVQPHWSRSWEQKNVLTLSVSSLGTNHIAFAQTYVLGINPVKNDEPTTRFIMFLNTIPTTDVSSD